MQWGKLAVQPTDDDLCNGEIKIWNIPFNEANAKHALLVLYNTQVDREKNLITKTDRIVFWHLLQGRFLCSCERPVCSQTLMPWRRCC